VADLLLVTVSVNQQEPMLLHFKQRCKKYLCTSWTDWYISIFQYFIRTTQTQSKSCLLMWWFQVVASLIQKIGGKSEIRNTKLGSILESFIHIALKSTVLVIRLRFP